MQNLALIMAAGEGTRMISSTPKLLHKVCGMPLVEHVLRALDPLCEEKALIVGRERDRMIEAFRGQAQFVQQAEGGSGTGCAVRSAAGLLAGRDGAVLVAPGDMPLVLPETYARLLAEVEKGNACAVLADRAENPLGYGRVIRENGRVCAVVEQRDLTGAQYAVREISASVYCFDVKALLWALPQLPPRDGEYLLSDVVSILYKGGYAVTAVPALEKSECLGVNDRVQLAAAERELRRRINARHMRAGVTIVDPENTYIQTDVSIGQDTTLHPGCSIEQGTTIENGCKIRASRIVGAHIGAGSKIEQSVIVGARVAPGSRIGPFAYVNPGDALAKK